MRPASGGDTVIVERANLTTMKKTNDSTNLIILEGSVVLRQGKTIFKCNRCVKNDRAKTFEAWGNVHINDSDTTNIYSEHLLYLMDKQIAYLDKNVKLTDGHAVLTTPSLEYNMATNIASYKNGGKVVNKQTVITSKEAMYYTDMKDAYFIKNVLVNDPAYHIVTDSLLYNTNNQTARFIAYTIIKDSADRTIKTRDGFYDLRTGKAEFGQRPIIYDNKTTLNADNVALNDTIAQAQGNAIVVDSTRGTTIIANLIYQNRQSEAVLATQKPLMIVKQGKDSVYIAADTLFSAKLTDLYTKRNNDSLIRKDSLIIKNKQSDNDSTNRYFEAYHHVRIYSDSVQAVCDSLFYSFRDSTFRLYKNPVVWGKESQITGDTILLHTQNKQPKWFRAINNGFMINHIEREAFNQIKASHMDGYFTAGNLDSVLSRGSAECIYYLQDDDSAYTGVNQSTSDAIDMYMKEKQLHKVVFRSQVTGTIYPIKQKSPEDMRLQGFHWFEAIRPKTKFDLF